MMFTSAGVHPGQCRRRFHLVIRALRLTPRGGQVVRENTESLFERCDARLLAPEPLSGLSDGNSLGICVDD
jgi:hypothetical protein